MKNHKKPNVLLIHFPQLGYSHHTCRECGGIPEITSYNISWPKYPNGRLMKDTSAYAVKWIAKCKDCGTLIANVPNMSIGTDEYKKCYEKGNLFEMELTAGQINKGTPYYLEVEEEIKKINQKKNYFPLPI